MLLLVIITSKPISLFGQVPKATPGQSPRSNGMAQNLVKNTQRCVSDDMAKEDWPQALQGSGISRVTWGEGVRVSNSL